RLPRQVRAPARGTRQHRRRPLRSHRPLGAARVRPPRHRLGADARFRAVLKTFLPDAEGGPGSTNFRVARGACGPLRGADAALARPPFCMTKYTTCATAL